MGKPQKTRSEVEDMVLEELKGRHPALEIEGNFPVDDIGALRSQADVVVAKVRERFEITED
jgi:hypothetical protein